MGELPLSGPCTIQAITQHLIFLVWGKWPSIAMLMSDTGPFWKALQLHHSLNSITNPQGFGCHLTTLEKYCSDTGTLALSKTYKLLNTPSEQPHLPCIWKIGDGTKPYIYVRPTTMHCGFSLKSSICTKIQEAN